MKLSLELCHKLWKTLNFLQNIFLSHIENAALMWVQDCCKEGIREDTKMIQKK